ncbi:MAG TPA: phosphate acyltransferase PlsX [Phycisphaerales bacterium]|nr:phosphate acyltransferase PlsX [Phycisphaerales bacterium]
MRFGVDVMGGDNAPGAILEGALAALDLLPPEDEVVLAGDESVIRAALVGLGPRASRVVVVPTTETIGMDESPVEAVRSKPKSSLVMLAQMSSPKKAEQPLDAFISAGSTGAQVTAAQMYMRRLPNVIRPGIAVTVPTFSGPIVLIDVGANIEPKPQHLAQYGVMGDVYARDILGIKNPRVALMNVGGEEQKGTTDMREARDLLRSQKHINFTGYVEGRGVFDGEADVVITDGVVGNVMIKLAEGLASGIFKAIAREVAHMDRALAQKLEPVFKNIYSKHDYHEYGGAPLLGVNGVCIICHGSSVARTITNAILRSRKYVELGVNQAISQRLASMEEVAA